MDAGNVVKAFQENRQGHDKRINHMLQKIQDADRQKFYPQDAIHETYAPFPT